MNILTDLDKFKKDAVIGLREGKPLSGKDGVLTPLIKSLLEAALDAEMDLHLESDSEPNRRNGNNSKTLKSEYGSFELNTPRDRNLSFQPQIVKKRQTFLGNEIESKILSLYGLGMINSHISEKDSSSIKGLAIKRISAILKVIFFPSDIVCVLIIFMYYTYCKFIRFSYKPI